MRVVGVLAESQRLELPGFVETGPRPGRLFTGTVPDQAALYGVLARLHRAGLDVYDVEQPAPRGTPGLHVQVQVEGWAAAYLSDVLGPGVVATEPRVTVLEAPISGQRDLFCLIERLESLGVVVRELHVRA